MPCTIANQRSGNRGAEGSPARRGDRAVGTPGRSRALRASLDRAEHRPRHPAVAAFEDAGYLGTGEDAALAAVSPDTSTASSVGRRSSGPRSTAATSRRGRSSPSMCVPIAGGRREDRAGLGRVNDVVDRPATRRTGRNLPVTPGCVAREHKGALASADQGEPSSPWLTSLQRAQRDAFNKDPRC